MWYKYTYSLIIGYISWLYYPRIIYNTYKLTFTLIYYTCYESYKLTIYNFGYNKYVLSVKTKWNQQFLAPIISL